MSLLPSWRVVEQFEERMAGYTGAPLAVAVDTCTWAIFLALKRHGVKEVLLPARTYLGVATMAVHAGASVKFADYRWEGIYPVSTSPTIIDAACRMRKGMHRETGGTWCLSFQTRKHLKIGRGGMILTDSAADADWYRKARFLGRGEHNGEPEFLGWHCFMEPERAARGFQLMDSLPDDNPDLNFSYPDLQQYEVLK